MQHGSRLTVTNSLAEVSCILSLSLSSDRVAKRSVRMPSEWCLGFSANRPQDQLMSSRDFGSWRATPVGIGI